MSPILIFIIVVEVLHFATIRGAVIPALSSITCDETTTESYDSTTRDICWLKIASCIEDNGATTWIGTQSFIQSILPHAISIKFVPPGSKSNGAYDTYALVAKPCSNPVWAINNAYEVTFTVNTANGQIIEDWASWDASSVWIGTVGALARLDNECNEVPDPGIYPRSFFDMMYQACGGGGLHLGAADPYCAWVYGMDGPQDIEVYIGFETHRETDCYSTYNPTTNPTKTPSANPTPSPTEQPTPSPTDNPTPSPTEQPTNAPSLTPSDSPTQPPSNAPSIAPSLAPSVAPTMSSQPTRSPSQTTSNPTSAPSIAPSSAPSLNPSLTPSIVPTPAPTTNPTPAPTNQPSISPTKSNPPTISPTQSTNNPTRIPTDNPSRSPTKDPTPAPSNNPTANPSKHPTVNPTITPVTTNYTVSVQINNCHSQQQQEDISDEILQSLNNRNNTNVVITNTECDDDTTIVVTLSIKTPPGLILQKNVIKGAIEGEIKNDERFGEIEVQQINDDDDNDDQGEDALTQIMGNKTIVITGIIVGVVVCCLLAMCCLFCVYYYGKHKAQSKILKIQSVQLSKMQSMSSVNSDVAMETNETNEMKEGNEQNLETTQPGSTCTLTTGHGDAILTTGELPVTPMSISNGTGVAMLGSNAHSQIAGDINDLPEEEEENDEYEYYEYDDEDEDEMMYDENNKHRTAGGPDVKKIQQGVLVTPGDQ